MPPQDERAFTAWYAHQAQQWGLNPNPDDPAQFYDYRAAFRAGAEPDKTGHWPSTFKRSGHPNMVVGGFNVQTGERVPGTKQASEPELVSLGWAPEDAKRISQTNVMEQQPTRGITSEGKDYDFPADATDAEISAFLNAIPASNAAQAPKARTWTDLAVDALPAAGAIVGGLVGASGGPLGAAVGAGVGGAGGEAWKQNINRLRGAETPQSWQDAATAIGKEGAIDAAVAGVGGAALKGAKSLAPAAGPAVSAVGRAVERAGEGTGIKQLSGAGMLYELLVQGDWKKALGSQAIPPLIRGAGRTMQAVGGAMERSGASAATQTAAQRAVNIPLQTRLAQIPQQSMSTASTASTAVTDLADDVLLIRASVAKGMAPQTAVRIIASGDADYADALTKAWTASLRSKGAPIPEAALKASGKVAPAVKELMESPTFKKLAQQVGTRQP